MMKLLKKFKDKKGAAALISVVIISAAAIIISRGLSYLTFSEIDAGVSLDKAEAAMYLSDGCVEETMRRIQLDSSYTAEDFVLEIGDDYCIINVTQNGDERTIISKGVHEDYNKSTEVVLNITDNEISIISWNNIEN